MKLLSTFILTLYFNAIPSLQQEKKEYTTTGVYLIINDLEGKEISRKPLGKDAMITYDIFFKKYNIAYVNSEQELEFMKFEYQRTDSDNRVISKDPFGNEFFIYDQLESNGKLLCIQTKLVNGYLSMILCE